MRKPAKLRLRTFVHIVVMIIILSIISCGPMRKEIPAEGVKKKDSFRRVWRIYTYRWWSVYNGV